MKDSGPQDPLTLFPPTRKAGLDRLKAFLPDAGRAYTTNRNFDVPGHPHVSRLSPYLRHRLVTEAEVAAAVLDAHSLSSAEKFVQEVFWRTYWKGWLEMRPSVWTMYREGVRRGLDRVQTEGGLRADWEAACKGDTGIACFDQWAQELVQTGYLHNHARMWFASIWIFTLRLPWELGADFFLRHLLDGDPASNTLGWRWVAGLQTPGKTYLARPDNIEKYTEGRFNPEGQLAEDAPPVDGPENSPRGAPPDSELWSSDAATGLLLTEDDLTPDYLFDDGLSPVGHAILTCETGYSPLKPARHIEDFNAAAAQDTLARIADRAGISGGLFSGADAVARVAEWASDTGLTQLVMPYAPIGPGHDAVNMLRNSLRDRNILLISSVRKEDLRAWPNATHGFFRFKDKIPKLAGAVRGIAPV